MNLIFILNNYIDNLFQGIWKINTFEYKEPWLELLGVKA